MSGKKGNVDAARALRRSAEAKLTAGAKTPDTTAYDRLRLIHELEVHAVELEMQNEELRRAQAEAEEIKEKYQHLYDFAPVGYFALDSDGVILEANLTGAAMLGRPRGALIGKHFDQFLLPPSRPAFGCFITRLYEDTKQSCEVQLAGNDWPSAHLHIEGIAVPGARMDRIECRTAVIDISERREMEDRIRFLNNELQRKAEQLETANRELQSVNRDLEAFGWTITHELRRPLTYIHSAAEVLELEPDQLTGQQREMAEIVRHSCQDMSKMITNVFKLSRTAWGTLSCAKTDLSRMAREIVTEYHLMEPERQAAFLIPSGLVACCDRGLARIVLEHLLGNAWKFTAHCEMTRIEFGCNEQGGEQVYFVRDNGVGFDKELLQKLFVPFFRLGDLKDLAGSGVGLATVQLIIQRHGGRVWAETGETSGATVYFTFLKGIAAESTP